jgi:hypothetical protein
MEWPRISRCPQEEPLNRIMRCALGVVSLAVFGCQGVPPAPKSLDTRTPVALPPEAVEAVRLEMRTMLTSVDALHRALATQDTALARRAAVASGLAAAADPALEPLLPAEFLRLGIATHSAFDSLAVSLSARAPIDTMLTRLSRITSNCVACHAIYRLVPAVAPPVS